MQRIFGNSLQQRVRRVQFDHRMYQLNLHILNNNVTVQQCYEILQKYLISDIKINKSSDLFQEYIDIHLKPFFNNVMQYFLLIGFCVWRVSSVKNKKDGKKIPVPMCINPQFFDIYLDYDYIKCKYKFIICEVGSPKPLNNFFVMPFASIDDLFNDSLIYSPLNVLHSYFDFLKTMETNYVRAQTTNSNPTIYLCSDNSTNTNMNTLSMYRNSTSQASTSFGAGGRVDDFELSNILNVPRVSDTLMMDTARNDIMSNSDFHFEQIQKLSMQYAADKYQTNSNYVPQYYNNMCVFPQNLKLACNVQAPKVDANQVSLNTFFNSNVFSAFGIPEPLFGINYSGVSNSYQSRTTSKPIGLMDISTFETTLEKYKFVLSTMFRLVYEETFKSPASKLKVEFHYPMFYEYFVKQLLESLDNKEKEKDGDKEKPKPKPKKAKNKAKDNDNKQTEKPKTKESGNDKENADDKNKDKTKPKTTADDKNKESSEKTKKRVSENSDSETRKKTKTDV